MKGKKAAWQTKQFKKGHGRMTIVEVGYPLLPMTVIPCCYSVVYGYVYLYEAFGLCGWKHISNYLLKVISYITKKPEIVNQRKKKSCFTTSSTTCCFTNNILSSLPAKAILHKKKRVQACCFAAAVVVCAYIGASLEKIIPVLTLHYEIDRSFHLEDPKELPVNHTGNCNSVSSIRGRISIF